MSASYSSFKDEFNRLMVGAVDRIPMNLGTKWSAIRLNYNPKDCTFDQILKTCNEEPMIFFSMFINFYNNSHDTAFFILCVKKGLINNDNIGDHLRPLTSQAGNFNADQVLACVCLSVICTDQIPKAGRNVMSFITTQCPGLEDYFKKCEKSVFIESEMHLDWVKRIRLETLLPAWQQRIMLGVAGFRNLNALFYISDNYMTVEERKNINNLKPLLENMSFVFHNRFGLNPGCKAMYDKIKSSLAFYIKKFNIEQSLINEKHLSRVIKANPVDEIFTEREVSDFLEKYEYMFISALPKTSANYRRQVLYRMWDLEAYVEWVSNGKPYVAPKKEEDDDDEKKEEEKNNESGNSNGEAKKEEDKDKDLLPKEADNKMKLKNNNPKQKNESQEYENLDLNLEVSQVNGMGVPSIFNQEIPDFLREKVKGNLSSGNSKIDFGIGTLIVRGGFQVMEKSEDFLPINSKSEVLHVYGMGEPSIFKQEIRALKKDDSIGTKIIEKSSLGLYQTRAPFNDIYLKNKVLIKKGSIEEKINLQFEKLYHYPLSKLSKKARDGSFREQGLDSSGLDGKRKGESYHSKNKSYTRKENKIRFKIREELALEKMTGIRPSSCVILGVSDEGDLESS